MYVLETTHFEKISKKQFDLDNKEGLSEDLYEALESAKEFIFFEFFSNFIITDIIQVFYCIIIFC